MTITSNVSGNSFKIAIESTRSVEETVKVIRGMESFFAKSQLGDKYLVVAEKLFKLGDFRQVLIFGKKALTNFQRRNNRDQESYLQYARVSLLLASSCFELKKYEECLSYLEPAYSMMKSTLLADGGSFDDLIADGRNYKAIKILADIQMELHHLKDSMGKRDESAVHVVNVLRIKQKILVKDCIELGDANVFVSEAYLRAFNHRGALPYCWKAIKIYEKHFRFGSLEVAEVQRSLALIYQDMGEYISALAMNQAALTVFADCARDYAELPVLVEIEGVNMAIELGRYSSSFYTMKDIMKNVFSHGSMLGGTRVKACLTMAKAMYYWDSSAENNRYISKARKMLEGKIEDHTLVFSGFSDLSLLYLMKNDLETAISMMKRALDSPSLPQKLLEKFCESLSSLISKLGKEKDDIPYMVEVVKKLEETFGPEHCVVGYGYSSLGAAYMRSGQVDLVATSLANAQAILEITLGSHHLTCLKISHDLVVAHTTLERFEQAIVIEEKVIEGLTGLKGSELFLHEACEYLSKLKKRVAESRTGASPDSKDDEDLAEKIAQCGISDEENRI